MKRVNTKRPKVDFRSVLPTHIASVFDCMEYAEKEINAAKGRHPEHAEKIQKKGFMLLLPGVLRDFAKPLYSHHCAELLDRLATGEDTRPGTKAEAIVVLSEMSLKAPPNGTATALYGRLFAEVFGWEEHPNDLGHELHAGACDELLAEIRRKTANDDRRVKP